MRIDKTVAAVELVADELGDLGDLGGLGPAVSYAVLSRHRDVPERAMAREGEPPRVVDDPPLTDEGPLRAFWRRFDDLGPFERPVIDAGSLDAARTAALVIDVVSRGAYRLAIE